MENENKESQHSFITLQSGVRLHYWEEGQTNDETVVLLHAFASWSYTWKDIIPKLSQRYHVIAPDMMGFGYSDKPTDAKYSLAIFASQLKELLKIKQISKATLVGNSMGGGIAIKFSLAHREMVERLVLVDSMGAATRMNLHQPFFKLLFNPLAVKLGWHRPSSALVGWVLRNSVFYDPSKVDLEKIEAYRRPLLGQGGMEAPWQTTNSFSARFPNSELRTISVPTLIVWGENDRVSPIKDSKIFLRFIPESTLQIIPRCGHFPQEEQPQAFVDILLKQISEGR